MILDCADLERALRTPELMPDMRAHAETCPRCAEELHLWSEISRVAPQLREEWESPFLWSRIQANLQADRGPRRAPWWRWMLAASGSAAVIALAAIMLFQPGRPRNPAGERALLTDRALREVQQTEAAYVKSVEKLSALATAEIERSPSPLGASYREKLAMLDSAIAEAKAVVEQNRYNAHLREELTSLYQEKQRTLQDWLKDANRN